MRRAKTGIVRRPVSERRRADILRTMPVFGAAQSLALARPTCAVLDADCNHGLVVERIYARRVLGDCLEDIAHYAIRRLGLASEDNFFQALLRKGPAIAVTRVEDPIAGKTRTDRPVWLCKVNSSYSASSNKPSGNPVAGITSIFPL